MDTGTTFLVAFAAAFLAYEVTRLWILHVTEEVRLEFAEMGKRLLVSPSLNEEQKTLISSMLDDVFDWRFMAFATFTFPVVMLGYRNHEQDRELHEFMKRDEVERFVSLHFKCVSAASPFFTLTFVIVATFTILLLLAFVGITALSSAWGDSVSKISPKVGRSNGQISGLV